MNPEFRASGRAVWLLPAIFFLVSFVGEMFVNPQEVIPEFFGTNSNTNSEAAIIALLITFPTATCCSYALGIRWTKETAHGH
jgi:hypothetical protein